MPAALYRRAGPPEEVLQPAHPRVTGPQRTQWARQLRGSTWTTSLRPQATQ